MLVDNNKDSKWSDWSLTQTDNFLDRQPSSIDNTESHDHPKEKSMKWWSSMSPCLQGVLLGIFTNALTLATVLTLWLGLRYQTGVIITNELPPGSIILFAGNLSTLNGTTHRWLFCDGSAVSRLIYSDLFDVIGTIYGSGNGIDTFNLPNFGGRFPLGSTGSSTTLLVTGGTATHTLTVGELPTHDHDQGSLGIFYNGTHNHSYTDPGHNHGGSTGSGPFSGGSFAMIASGGAGNDGGGHAHAIPLGTTGITIESDGNHTHAIQGFTGSIGSNIPIDKMPPYQTIHYIIRA